MSDIAGQIRPASDSSLDTLTMLLIGPPGSGKTHLAKTAADAGHKVLLLDAESGTMSIRRSTVDVLPVKSWADCRAAYKYVSENLGLYDVIFVDSLTEMQKLRIESAREIINEKTGKVMGKKPRPTLEDWQYIIQDTSAYCRAWRDLPVSAVITALTMERAVDGELLVRPSVSGKLLPEQLGGLFDIVGLAQAGESGEGYSIRFSAAGARYQLKDRSSDLAAVEPSDYAAIHNKVFNRENQ